MKKIENLTNDDIQELHEKVVYLKKLLEKLFEFGDAKDFNETLDKCIVMIVSSQKAQELTEPHELGNIISEVLQLKQFLYDVSVIPV